MNEVLTAICGARQVGRLHCVRNRLSFEYDRAWQEDRAAFPLSLSMPLTRRRHDHAVVLPFIAGLLPDNPAVLRRWGQRFHVSAHNPFSLLSHVGEECAGAVQFVTPEKAERWLSGDAPDGVDWLTTDELIERMADLATDHANTRRLGDAGHFSLAGAQAKTGLFRDAKKQRWGIPQGATPTTHILKPNVGGFSDYEQNENFCLQLAHRLGLPTAHSWTERIGDIAVVIVERFDRTQHDGQTIRIHQEDCCQALHRMPDLKYQNQGGPSAADIFELIWDHSSKHQEDIARFLDALIYNWLIGGTDAHAKNYGFLLAGGGQVRLAPLYDLSSSLPYAKDIPPQKAKLAMTVGREYRLQRIGLRHWEKAADEWRLDHQLVMSRISTIASAISAESEALANEMTARKIAPGSTLSKLITLLSKRAAGFLADIN